MHCHPFKCSKKPWFFCCALAATVYFLQIRLRFFCRKKCNFLALLFGPETVFLKSDCLPEELERDVPVKVVLSGLQYV